MKEKRKRPRILLITRNFPPLTGGMERLIQNAALGMSEYADLTIIGPKGCSEYAPTGAETREVPDSLALFVIMSTLAAFRVCFRQNFSIVLGGSGLTAPTLWLIKKAYDMPTAVFVHGLDIVVDNVVFQKLFVPALKHADLVIANSKNTKQLAINAGTNASSITVINPGTDLPEVVETHYQEAFVDRHNLKGKNVVLFTGRITRRKGLSGFIKHCFPLILEREPDTVLLVVGDSPEQSLNKQGEIEDVVKAVTEASLQEHTVFLGKVSEQDLLHAYAAAKVQILPLVETPGDVEGFGMVAIEAAALGTPTIALDLGGVTDAISSKNGAVVPAGKYDLFAEAVVRTIRTSKPDDESCREHASRFSWEHFNGKMQLAISSILPDNDPES